MNIDISIDVDRGDELINAVARVRNQTEDLLARTKLNLNNIRSFKDESWVGSEVFTQAMESLANFLSDELQIITMMHKEFSYTLESARSVKNITDGLANRF